MKVLQGHISPETAYVVEDYPYGFRLRCTIRYWIETKPKFGQRMMSQTTNPKKAGVVWNKPNGSTYSAVLILCLDEKNHVVSDGLSKYSDEERINAFVAKYGKLGDYEEKEILVLRAVHRAQSRLTCTIVANPTPEEHAKIDANNARVARMMPGMVAQEMGAIRAEQAANQEEPITKASE